MDTKGFLDFKLYKCVFTIVKKCTVIILKILFYCFPDHKLIVFDDFPSGNNDSILFDKLIQSSRSQHIPMVYFEGPKSNLTTGEIIRSQFPSFIPTAIDSDIFTSLSDEHSKIIDVQFKLSSFPPQFRSVKWTTDSNGWVNFADGSFMIANKNDVYIVAIPDIT